MSSQPASRRINCRHCGKQTVFSAENPFRPFCSERCRMIDLGEWASESYRVPTTNFTPGEDLEAELEAEESRRDSTEDFKKN